MTEIDNHIAAPIVEPPQYYPGGCSSTRCTHCNEWCGIDELDNVECDVDGNSLYYCDACHTYAVLGVCAWCEEICDPDYGVVVKVEGGVHPDYPKTVKVCLHNPCSLFGTCLTVWLKNFEETR